MSHITYECIVNLTQVGLTGVGNYISYDLVQNFHVRKSVLYLYIVAIIAMEVVCEDKTPDTAGTALPN